MEDDRLLYHGHYRRKQITSEVIIFSLVQKNRASAFAYNYTGCNENLDFEDFCFAKKKKNKS